MKKTFKIGNTEYKVSECTAICKDMGESERRKALYVYNISESEEKHEFVIFDYKMPKNEAEFLEMCEDSSAWNGWFETVESVEIKE